MSNYPAIVKADNPNLYLRLGDARGSTTVRDEMASVTPAVSAGCTLGVAGLLTADSDTACLFNGTTGNINIGVYDNFAGALPFTFECTIKPGSGGAGLTNNILSNHVVLNGIQFVQNTDGTIHLFRGDGAARDDAAGPAATVANGVYHCVGVFSGTVMTVYINSVPGTPVASTRNVAALGNSLRLGTNSGATGSFYNGTIDEVVIYPFALTAAQVLARYLGVTAATDFPDWCSLVQIVGSNVNIPIAIQASNATLNVSITASTITINMTFTGQTTYVATGSQYGALVGNGVFLVGAASPGAFGAMVTCISYTVPAAKTFYQQGMSFGGHNNGNQMYATNCFLMQGGVPQMEFLAQVGDALVFDTPIPHTTGVVLTLQCQAWAAGALALVCEGSMWGWLG